MSTQNIKTDVVFIPARAVFSWAGHSVQYHPHSSGNVEEQLKTLLKASLTGVYKVYFGDHSHISDTQLVPEGSWLAIEPELLGLPTGTEVTFEDLQRVLYKDDIDAAVMHINRAIEQRESAITNIVGFTRSDGTQGWLESRLSIEFDDTDQPFCMSGSLRDITSQLQAEANLRKMGSRITDILSQVPIAIFHQDIDGDQTEVLQHTRPDANWMVNASLLFGRDEDDIKSPLDLRRYMNEDDLEAINQLHAEAMNKGLDRYEVEFRTHLPDGSLHWIACKSLLERDRHGKLVAIDGIQYDVTERKLQHEQLEFMARHDSLTNLPNRALCQETLARTVSAARRYDRGFAVLYIDLDRFKFVNDTLGHHAGDELLVEISKRFCSVLRSSEFVARLGGDEFLVIAEGITNAEQARVVAEKLIKVAIEPVTVVGQECRVTASVGIGLYPQHGEDEQELMQHADMAMYAAKDKGKNTYEFYAPAMSSRSEAFTNMEQELMLALERDEFFLQYQPKVNLQSNSITGAEALLRWKNERLGLVPPNRFIPLAEKNGLIKSIGKWVLNTACAQAREWERAGLSMVPMAVNISSCQFMDEGFYDDVVDALATTGISPRMLELELTEGLIMRDVEHALSLMTAFKALGVRVAIDDFGTGYSSLAKMRRFPIDTLKVDRSFVRNIQKDETGRAMTQAILSMAKTLSMTVVAEGVESIDEAHFLRGATCDEIQGYYFSQPVGVEEFTRLLANQSAVAG